MSSSFDSAIEIVSDENCKLTRTRLSLKDKMQVIEESAFLTTTELMQKFGISKSTVYSVLNRKAELQVEWMNSLNPESKMSRRNTSHEEINNAVLAWYCEALGNGQQVTGTQMQNKARQLADQQQDFTFKASNGWLHSFRKRNVNIFKSEEYGRSLVLSEISKASDDDDVPKRMKLQTQETLLLVPSPSPVDSQQVILTDVADDDPLVEFSLSWSEIKLYVERLQYTFWAKKGAEDPLYVKTSELSDLIEAELEKRSQTKITDFFAKEPKV